MRSSSWFESVRGMIGFTCANLLVVATCLAEPAPAQPGKEKGHGSSFLRIQRDDQDRPISLDTAVVRYQPKPDGSYKNITVDLIGAVHVGERAYFQGLNRLFTEYDAVLYELVAPPDSSVPAPGQRSGHPVSLMQMGIKNLLELDFQLDRVDYTKSNLVHADLSPDEFQASMKNRDESFSKLFFRLMGQGLAQQAGDPARSNEISILSALFSQDRATELKRTMALQFEEMEKATMVFDGPDGSAIITDRNNRALEVLQGQMAGGKKRIAIFYGAAHLPDFDRKLRGDLGFEPTSTKWLVAWDLRPAGSSASRRSK